MAEFLYRDVRQQLELATEEEDSRAVVGEAAEAAGVGADGLDLRIEALGERVGDVESPAVNQMLERFARGGSAELGGEGRLLSYAYQRTRDPVFLSVRREVEGMPVGNSIRGIGINLSQAPWFIGALAQEGAIARGQADACCPGTAAKFVHDMGRRTCPQHVTA